MKEERRVDRRLYAIHAGQYSGVVMPESVMKRVMKLQAKYNAELRKVLDDSKDELFVSDWTLANHEVDGKIEKQVTIQYALEVPEDGARSTVESRIKLFKVQQPLYIENFYLVKSREEAQQIAEEVLAEEMEVAK